MINVTAQISGTIDHVKESIAHSRLAQNRLVVLVWRVSQGMAQDDATHLAAGVAFYAIFSIFPLLMGLLAIVGLVLDSEESQQGFLRFVAENLPGSAEFVADNLEQIVRLRGPLGIGAIIGLLWAGRVVFAAMSRAVNRAWGIRKDRPFYFAIPRQLAMTMIVGGLFLVSTAATSFIQFFTNGQLTGDHQGLLLDLGMSALALYLVPWAITLLVFLVIYRYVPNRRMRWRYVWPGALVAAVLFEAAKTLFLWYLDGFAVYDQVYGPLASVIVLMMWAYLSSLVLFLGAEISCVYEKVYYPQREAGAPPQSETQSVRPPPEAPIC